MNCQKCNFQNEETAKFCRDCGAELIIQQQPSISETKTCPKCNFQNANDFHLCGNCGEKLYTVVIPHEKYPRFDERNFQRDRINGFGIIGLILSPIAIFCFIGYYQGFSDMTVELVTTLSLLGLTCSFIGIFRKNKKKWPAIIGLVLSGIVLTSIVYDMYYVKNVAIAIEESPKEGVVIKGTRWATRNVGERGTFVAQPHYSGNKYTWEEAENACPSGWRLPTENEINDLLHAPNRWITINGVGGRVFGTPPNVIFLRYSDDYWSGTKNYYLYVKIIESRLESSGNSYSLSVRPVAE